ncbi:MAG: hypothetical protein CFE21_06585 [Bacteroidetes bacterium B1(2017)]|nr:MAG: hypothetical protein CFE21_06585 [Bacteroidetes bacterium B1(2017)]
MKSILTLTYTKSWILVLVTGFFAFLFHVQNPVVREWDEATYGINAYEMSQSNNPIVVTFNHQSDVYNSKPPFGVWLMSLSTKIFGVNTFSLRFPSALLAYLFSCFLFYFIYKEFKNLEWALFASLILIGSIGFTGWHEARSGDFDAMVAVFMALAILYFSKAILLHEPQRLLLFFLFLTLACLTKGVYGLIILPGLFLFTSSQKQLKWSVSQWQLYIGFVAFLISFMGYYFLRERMSPGYFKAVLENEVGERVFLETNIHKTEIPFYYHTVKLLVYRFQPFILLLPFFAVKFWFEPSTHEKRFLTAIVLSAASIWCVISFSKTKLVWYDGSLYPLLAICLGWFISVQSQKLRAYATPALLLIATFVFYLNYTEKDSFEFPHFLKELRTQKQVIEPLKVYSTKFEHPIRYYLLQDSLACYKSSYTNDIKSLNVGDWLIVNLEEQPISKFDSIFEVNPIFDKGKYVLLVLEEKPN